MTEQSDPLNDALEYFRDETLDGNDVSLTNAQARLVWDYMRKLNAKCAALAALQYPANPDATGKMREPPHCPSCACGLSPEPKAPLSPGQCPNCQHLADRNEELQKRIHNQREEIGRLKRDAERLDYLDSIAVCSMREVIDKMRAQNRSEKP